MDREHQEELLTLDLFTSPSESRDAFLDLQWPHVSRFPLNTGSANVKKVVLGDLKRSSDSLLVTGYASLDQIIDFSCDACTQSEHQVRLLIGNEPFLSRRDTYSVKRNGLTHEMEAYWLQRGISLRLSAKLLLFIQELKQGHVEARYMSGAMPLHAQIYDGDKAATVGSSNYREMGLRLQQHLLYLSSLPRTLLFHR